MNDRPKIAITPTRFDVMTETGSVVFLAVMWLFTIFAWLNFPGTIPTHFDGGGKPNDYGSRHTIFILPVIGTLIFIAFTRLSRYPHIFNYMTPITPENAERQYSNAVRMLRVLKLMILILFTMIVLFTWLTVGGITKGLSKWFLPCMIVAFFIPTAILLFKALRK